jgi:hypothetical protein
VAAAALALLLSGAAADAQEGAPALSLLGLPVGTALDAAQQRFPGALVSQEVYRDARVDDRYSLVLGRTLPRQITLRGWETANGGARSIDADFTGEGKLHDLLVTESGGHIRCARLQAQFRQRYGAPRYSAGGVRVWVRFTLDDRRFLRLDCVDGEYWLGHLYSATMQERYLAELRRQLEPVILQTLNQIQ